MNEAISQFPRAIRPAPEPLGLYFRAAYNDHKALIDVIGSGGLGFHGIVFDPLNEDRHSELHDLVLELGRDAILDPRTQELGSKGGYQPKMAKLPWATDVPHGPGDFLGDNARRIAETIAKYVIEKRYTAVLAPTHYIESANSPWLDLDAQSTRLLRICLDRYGAQDIPIFYSLAVSYRAFRTAEERSIIQSKLVGAPVESIWLKVALGSNVTHASIRNYVNGAAELHALGIPLVGDMMGGLRALSALAFGAVAGIAHGLTQKERFNAAALTSPRKEGSKGWIQPTRVYVPTLDMYLNKDEARVFFAARNAKSRFACMDSDCCPNGAKDMIGHPARHFLRQRSGEIQRISAIPEQRRAERFLEEVLRPMTDSAIFAEKLKIDGHPELTKRLEHKRKAVELLRIGLGEFVQKEPPTSFSKIPRRRVARSHRVAS